MLARVVAVAAAGLLAIAGTGIVAKLTARPAHAACSAGGGGGGHIGSGGHIHLTGGGHHRAHFGGAFAHSAAVIQAAYGPGRHDRPHLGGGFEAFVALPTGVHQGRNAAR